MSNGAFSMSSNSGSGVGLAMEAARQGAADARASAERFTESAGRFAARFLYTTCYTLSYGVVFPSMVVARAIPRDNAAVRGLIAGAGAATRKADAIVHGDAPLVALPWPPAAHS